MVGTSPLEGTVEELQSELADVSGTLSAICDEFSLYDGALFDTYLAAC